MTVDNSTSARFRSGYITILGAPNAGKSTLLNRLLGEKISITSKKPQTTRNRILGVLHRERAQMVFLDTPGVHATAKLLNTRIVEVAVASIQEADAVLLIVDLSSRDLESERILLKKLETIRRPIILALNKTDLAGSDTVLSAIDELSKGSAFTDIVPVSAKHGTQVDDLMEAMENQLPEGPPFFPEDSITDVSERFIAAEMIREKVFRLTGEEIPYSIAVTVEQFKEKPSKRLVHIDATIHVERNSQKRIIIGKHGAKLKEIGSTARVEIERMLGSRVFLKLFVRVQKNWTKDTKAIRRFGY